MEAILLIKLKTKEGVQIVHMFPYELCGMQMNSRLFLPIFFSYEFFFKFIENIALLLLLPRIFLSSGGVLSSS
jgi:hypothetical protein